MVFLEDSFEHVVGDWLVQHVFHADFNGVVRDGAVLVGRDCEHWAHPSGFKSYDALRVAQSLEPALLSC